MSKKEVEEIVRALRAKADLGERPKDVQDILDWALSLKQGPIYVEAFYLDRATSNWDYRGNKEVDIRAFAKRHRAAYKQAIDQ